ncbi:uncharacterized protein LOC128860279 isoform X1 [Anastrepha ludens]|uniref:uncharacterized protein LOC128860279 isoform X1 n=1 Tax=Anastrepha ludens TaxID=28586 RepID=UPI0023B07D81|nr:uncharacterized protein LOC128860279 isoform X1 [Anastrepha ludens]
MRALHKFLWLLVAFTVSPTLILARPSDELASRLAFLVMDPANDERFNEIEHSGMGEIYYPETTMFEKQRQLGKNILPNLNVTTSKPDDSEEPTEDKRSLMRSMLTSVFNFMQRFIL